jgi:MFS family permease
VKVERFHVSEREERNMRAFQGLNGWAILFAAGWAGAIGGLLQFLVNGPSPWRSPEFVLVMAGLALVSTLAAAWIVPVGRRANEVRGMPTALISAAIFAGLIGIGFVVLFVVGTPLNALTLERASGALLLWLYTAFFAVIISAIAAMIGTAVFNGLLRLLALAFCSVKPSHT